MEKARKYTGLKEKNFSQQTQPPRSQENLPTVSDFGLNRSIDANFRFAGSYSAFGVQYLTALTGVFPGFVQKEPNTFFSQKRIFFESCHIQITSPQYVDLISTPRSAQQTHSSAQSPALSTRQQHQRSPAQWHQGIKQHTCTSKNQHRIGTSSHNRRPHTPRQI